MSLIDNIATPTPEEAYEILKSAGTEELFQKAHQDGDIHPNGKWVWVSSAAGGKGDWRVKGGRVHTAHAAAQTPKAVSTHHQKWMDFVKKQKDGVVSGEIHKKWDKVDAAYGYGMTKINHYFQEAIKLSMQLNENNGQIGVFSKQIRDLQDSIRKEVYDSARTLEQNLQHRLTGVKPNTKRYNDMHNAVDDMVYQIEEHGNHCLDAIYKITAGQEFLDYLKEMQSAKNKRKQDALDGKAAVTRDMLTSEFEDAGFRITDRDTFSGKRVRITELANGNFEVKFQDAYSNGKVVNEISKKYGMTVTLDKNKSTFGYSVVILSKKKNQTTTTSPKSKDSIQTAADRLKLQQEYSTLNNLIKKPSSKKYADDIRKRMDEIRALGYQGDGKWKDGKTVSTLTGKPEFASTGEVISGKQQSNTSQSTQGNTSGNWSRAVAEAKKSGKATPSLLGRVMDNGTPKEVAEIQSVITQMIDGTTDMTMIDKTISQVKADRKRGNTNYVKASDWTLDVLNKRKKFLQSAVGKFETEVVQRMKDSGIKLPMINRDSRGLKKRKDFWLDIETKGMSDIEIAKIERVCNQQGWKFQTGSGHSHVIMPGDNPSGSESKSTKDTPSFSIIPDSFTTKGNETLKEQKGYYQSAYDELKDKSESELQTLKQRLEMGISNTLREYQDAKRDGSKIKRNKAGKEHDRLKARKYIVEQLLKSKSSPTTQNKVKVPSGKRGTIYDDSLVEIYDDKGNSVHRGILDMSGYEREPATWNESDKNYDLPHGYKMVLL